jgi:hypothetical protein
MGTEIKFRDYLRVDLTQIQPERKEKIVRMMQDNLEVAAPSETPTKVPQLIVSVAATHAGVITRNHAFYRPDVMKDGLPTFVTPFPKPVQIHHSDHTDPVGRVRRAQYTDLSYKYKGPMQQFKNRFGGKNFVDAKTDTDKALDQVEWCLKNLTDHKDYGGLGFGKLDLYISDSDAAEKILDERYLTVSVGFTTDKAFCSNCKQDWANEGPCEHKPGELIDDLPMVLVPGSFLYDELSWVNNPADQSALPLSITRMDGASLSDSHTKLPMLETRAILIGAGKEGIFRIDSFKDVDPERAQEIQDVAGKPDTKKSDDETVYNITSAQRTMKERKKGDQVEEYEVLAVTIEGTDEILEFPVEVEDLLLTKDAKHVHYLTTEEQDHTHRAILDPATKNGHTSYDGNHGHSVMNEKVEESGEKEWSDDPPEYRYKTGAAHTHELDQKIASLTDQRDSNSNRIITNDPDKLPSKIADPDIDPSAKVEGPDTPPITRVDPYKVTIHKLSSDETKEVEVDVKLDDYSPPEGWEVVKEEPTELELDDNAFTADFYEKYIEPELDALGFSDAKLSAAQRKKLKGSTFCGPGRSFPVPDCAHVTAARRLIGRYKGSDATKKKIMACVNRKARSLGCDKSKDEFEPMQLNIAGQDVRIASIKDFEQLIKVLEPDQIQNNFEALQEAAKVLGIDNSLLASNSDINSRKTALEERIAEISSEADSVSDASFIDAFVLHLMNMDETRRSAFIEVLLDKFTANELIPDFDGDFNEVIDENDQLRQELKTLRSANRDLYQERQSFLAERVVDLNSVLKKEGYIELDDEARTELVGKFKIRSIDSLNDTVNDLMDELVGARETKTGLDNDPTPAPSSVKIKDDAGDPPDDTAPKKIDLAEFRGIDEHGYQLARILSDLYTGSNKDRK